MTTIEISMMAAFLFALGLSGWKLYRFIPGKQLEDDDTTPASTEELRAIMYDVIGEGELEEKTIFAKMQKHPRFDRGHYWRFNQNRLRKLLESHYLRYPEHCSIEHIHRFLQKDTATDR